MSVCSLFLLWIIWFIIFEHRWTYPTRLLLILHPRWCQVNILLWWSPGVFHWSCFTILCSKVLNTQIHITWAPNYICKCSFGAELSIISDNTQNLVESPSFFNSWYRSQTDYFFFPQSNTVTRHSQNNSKWNDGSLWSGHMLHNIIWIVIILFTHETLMSS